MVSTLFRDAVADELIEQTPFLLKSSDKPTIADKDREWRDTAEYTREELEALISDPRIPQNRRVWWALGLLTGMRSGETAALHWRHLDNKELPLQLLRVVGSYNPKHRVVKSTKTDRPRRVPVHPVLAQMLRRRRFHDARSTFITLGTVDGAEEVWLERVTHNAKGNIVNQYRRNSWLRMCEAVSCLRIQAPFPPSLQPVLQSTGDAMGFRGENEENNSAPGGTRTRRLTTEATSTDSKAVVLRLFDSTRQRQKAADCSDVVSPMRARLRALMARYAAGGK